MAAFLIMYSLIGVALLIGLAIYESIRKGPQDVNFAIEMALLYPPLLLLMVLMWPIAMLVVVFYYLMPDDLDEEVKSAEEDHPHGKKQNE